MSDDTELSESSSSEGKVMSAPSSESMSSEEIVAPLKEELWMRPTPHSSKNRY
ncbi:MAG: hypothetical protein OCC49_15935 [Fibrobacterales bacterium]